MADLAKENKQIDMSYNAHIMLIRSNKRAFRKGASNDELFRTRLSKRYTIVGMTIFVSNATGS